MSSPSRGLDFSCVTDGPHRLRGLLELFGTRRMSEPPWGRFSGAIHVEEMFRAVGGRCMQNFRSFVASRIWRCYCPGDSPIG